MSKMYTIHIGMSGFPFGNAGIQRLRLTFKGLVFAGKDSLILNKYSLHEKSEKKVNRYDGLPYVNLSNNVNRPKSFTARSVNKLSGIVNEFLFLYKKRKKIDSAVYYDSSFFALFYYRFLSRIFRFKLIVQYVEYRSAIVGRENLRYKFNDWLFDNYCTYFCDGIIVISEFLRQIVNKQRKSFSTIKVPVICDFSIITPKPSYSTGSFLLYTAAIEYMDIIEFVINTFVRVKSKGIYTGKLLLAIGGKDFKRLDKVVKECVYAADIIYKKNVPHTELLNIYLDADLLLIPLRKTVQDIARFPHKVGEYSAAGRAILATNVGEIGYYFKDSESAFLVEELDIEQYAKKIIEATSSLEKMAYVGNQGHAVGLESFDYKKNGVLLKEFLSSLR